MTGSKLYPVKVDGETRHVTVPGSGDQQPGPETEADFEAFLSESIESYAEASEIARPQISTFAEAGVLTENRGLVVRFRTTVFQLTVVRSR